MLDVFQRKWAKVKPFIYLSFKRYLYIYVHLSIILPIQANPFRMLSDYERANKLTTITNILSSALKL